MASRCASCAASVEPTARFCPACGAALETSPDSPTFTSDRPFEPAHPVGRIAHTPAGGGFTPGVVLASRYRVIGLIGRGGMGEVYRADDLTLGQPVALKFLPRIVHDDPVRRDRFFGEVRIARQVSHPNVCRVYDVAEADGRLFLSMEYVDGEDLASLLKRIGHLPTAKSLEIARQLCAGLAAAHDRGVLHRDLKPANVMIDGRGRVRITDFGLAVAADAGPAARGLEGTPAYMAPEQLEGGPASVQSDIYALGLVLYEVCTGERAFHATTLAELRALKDSETLALPSDVSADVDPLVERVILRCLDRDPRERPASVAQVAAALPGGDPLAAALAAGETPSPEMVAASAGAGVLRPAMAWTLLAVSLVGIVVTIVLGPRAFLLRKYPLTRPPEVMNERAREILQRLGFPGEAGDRAHGIEFNFLPLTFLRSRAASTPGRESIEERAIEYWYRESPRPFTRARAITSPARVTSDDPDLFFSDEVILVFDRHGRLFDLTAVPPQKTAAAPTGRDVDWAALFRDAGLDFSGFQPAAPEWNPRFYADTRVAWTPIASGDESQPLRVEGASAHGRPVNFMVIAPWYQPARTYVYQPTTPQLITIGIQISILAGVIVGAAFGARRQLRSGRGDRRGATRLVLFLVLMQLVIWMLDEDHVATPWELYLAITQMGMTLLVSTVFGLLYLAIEPYIRRTWPSTIVSWSRVLAGRLRDPLVGRDVLIGGAIGAVSTSLAVAGYGGDEPGPSSIRAFLGAQYVVPEIVDCMLAGVVAAFGWLLILVVLKAVLRREWPALVAGALIAAAPSVLNAVDPLWMLGFATAGMLLLVVTLARVGIVAVMVATAVSNLLGGFPTVIPPSPWYAGVGLVGLGVVAAIVLYGFVTAGALRQR